MSFPLYLRMMYDLYSSHALYGIRSGKRAIHKSQYSYRRSHSLIFRVLEGRDNGTHTTLIHIKILCRYSNKTMRAKKSLAAC